MLSTRRYFKPKPTGVGLVVFSLGLIAMVSALPADYAGTFKDDRLTVTLTNSQGAYTGTIELREEKFPCIAREIDGRLAGTFASRGANFEFTAILHDDTLSLESGGTSYTLKRLTLPVNPLARSSPSNPLAGSAGPAREGSTTDQTRTAITNANVVRLKKVSIADRPDMIGGEAFTFLAPADWVVEGGLVWRLHPTMPAAVAMRVRNPKGLEQLECFPTVAFSWGGYLGPGTPFPQGANYLGNEVQPPVQDAIAFLKERLIPLQRGQLRPGIVHAEELPKLAEAAREAEPAPPFGGPQMMFTAGRVRIEYELDGRKVEEDLYCVLNTISLPTGNMTIQIADKLYGVRAAKGQLDQATSLFQTMIHSSRVNLQWFNKYAQLVQSLTQAQMNQIRAAGELSRYISQTSSEISDMIRQSYEQRQASQDRINKNWSQYMRGVDEYFDPAAGRPVELPSGYKYAWANANGEYIVTDNANFNPNIELNGAWQQLEHKQP